MKAYVCEEPRTIALVSDSHSLSFRQLRLPSGPSNHPSVSVQMDPNSQITKSGKFKVLINREIHGCLGLINVAGMTYLAVITGAMTNVAHPVAYESVDRIFAVDFISLDSSDWDYVNLDSTGMPVQTNADAEDFDPNMPRVPHPCFELKKLLSNGSFYFSNDFDLTSLLQNRGIDKHKFAVSHHEDPDSVARINLQHYQEQYMWNSYLMEELIGFRNNLDQYALEIMTKNRFLTTVIRGFTRTVRLGSNDDTITIISKQSWKRAGTRFNARGIDDDGNVANFVETEFIYSNKSMQQVFAFTQIRGSVPAFWEQDSTLINPKITITRSRGATQASFDKHFDGICDRYGVCHIVNLLSKTKTQEVEVLRRYEELLAKSDHKDGVSYSAFDFHAETKQLSGGFAGASKILPQLYDSLEQFGWFDYDLEQDEVVTRQDGVFRVNCLDCLDRTNLIEQVICQCVLEHILKNQSLTHSNLTRDRYRLEEILLKHNTLWADNGDAISQIYTGTNALKSSFSRSGKMNFAGALSDVTKSVSRMYQNTFVDSKKQSTIDQLLGKDGRLSIPVKIYDPINEYVTERLKGVESQYTKHKDITIFVGTYNVNAAAPSPNIDLVDWLFPADNQSIGAPDIYAIGLQELIELNAGSILAADSTKPGQWAALLKQQLNSQQEKYLLLRTEAIASMSVFLFVKKSQVVNVTQVSGSSKKTGLGGMTANKGACAVRFDYGSTSFALITSHLAAGVGATVERHNDYSSIMLGLTFTRNYTIGDHDNIIWFGDLNYRINMQNDQCRSLIDRGSLDDLLEFDQLRAEMQQNGGAFRGFRESPLEFYPTYKFDKGTSNYDTSEKQRVPSWTDRVVYRSSERIQQLNYSSVMDVFASDHKPVYGTFRSRVKFVDEGKKHELSRQYYMAYKAEHGDSASLIDFDNGSESSQSVKSSRSSFSSDTLSEMNLLDEVQAPSPRLPTRPTSSTLHTPRRVPPPPMSRKANTIVGGADIAPSTSRQLPPVPKPQNTAMAVSQSDSVVSQASKTPPPPPSARKTTNYAFNLAFNAAPLIPSNTSTPKSTSPVSENPTRSEPVSLKPLKPAKPQALSAAKAEAPKSASVEPEEKSRPTPPPARATSTTPKATAGKTMMDWKPLVPQ